LFRCVFFLAFRDRFLLQAAAAKTPAAWPTRRI
jgi:hypothetical protein